MRSTLAVFGLYIGLIIYITMVGILLVGLVTMDTFLLKLCLVYWLFHIGILAIVLSFDYAPAKESDYNIIVTA